MFAFGSGVEYSFKDLQLSEAIFSCEVLGSSDWCSMEKLSSDLLRLNLVKLGILSTYLIGFLYDKLGELRSRSLDP